MASDFYGTWGHSAGVHSGSNDLVQRRSICLGDSVRLTFSAGLNIIPAFSWQQDADRGAQEDIWEFRPCPKSL